MVRGAVGIGVGAGGAVVAVKIFFADGGSLSALAQSRLTCHICVGESCFSNPGMPVMRMPPVTFQYVSWGVSSVTPLPSMSLGGLGNIPKEIAVGGWLGRPWQTAQLSLYTCAPAANAASSAGIGDGFGISLRRRACSASPASIFSNGIGADAVATGAAPVEKYI